MTAAEKKAEKKARNVAAYNARCEALKALQARANELRKQGFHGTDTQVIAAYQEYVKRMTVAGHLNHPNYGWHLRRWLAGRQDTRPLDNVIQLIERFLETKLDKKAA